MAEVAYNCAALEVRRCKDLRVLNAKYDAAKAIRIALEVAREELGPDYDEDEILELAQEA